MSKDPAFLFYPGDYLGGTIGMTFEEKGAYIELLMMQFTRGHMTSHMIGQTVGQLWVNIKDKFEVDEDGKFFNRRLDEEKAKRKSFTDSRKNNLSGNNQYSKSGNNNGHTTSHMEDENKDENKDELKNKKEANFSFEDFWNTYQKKTGSKEKLENKWLAFTDKIRTKIMEHVPMYVASTPDKQFRKDPQTYLNNEGWENEIIYNGEKNKGTGSGDNTGTGGMLS